MTSLIGNSVAGMIFDVAKSIDRVTITVYQSAAGEGIIAWLRNVTDRLITGLCNAIYLPYVAIVVLLLFPLALLVLLAIAVLVLLPLAVLFLLTLTVVIVSQHRPCGQQERHSCCGSNC